MVAERWRSGARMALAIRRWLLPQLPGERDYAGFLRSPIRHVVSQQSSQQAFASIRSRGSRRREIEVQNGGKRRVVFVVRRGIRCAQVHPLRVRENPAMANRTARAQDAVQRLRGEVQVGSTRTRVSTGLEPDVRADSALELAPQGPGAPKAEGAGVDEAAEQATPTRAMLSSPAWLQRLLTCQLLLGTFNFILPHTHHGWWFYRRNLMNGYFSLIDVFSFSLLPFYLWEKWQFYQLLRFLL